MSNSAFNIDPLFVVPIDYEENQKNTLMSAQNNIESDITIENLSFSKKNIISDNNIENDINLTNDLDQFEVKNVYKDYKNNCSFNIKDNKIEPCNDSNIINNNKIYITKCLKKNWKLKCRRLASKIKKRLVKLYHKSCKEQVISTNENSNRYKIEYVNINNNYYLNYMNNLNNNFIIENIECQNNHFNNISFNMNNNNKLYDLFNKNNNNKYKIYSKNNRYFH